MKYLLQIEKLSISFTQYYSGWKQRNIQPVRDLSLNIKEGEILGIVGGSGSGKSLLAHAILGLLPTNAILKGNMYYKNEQLTPAKITALRGKEFGYIPQSLQYLDPTRKVGKNLNQIYGIKTKQERIKQLKQLGLAEEVYDYYPHQLSGGMLRRILFATGVGAVPKLVIADEPTPGIHPDALEEIVDQINQLKKRGCSVIFITHDMKTAMKLSDRIAVFKEGTVVDCATPDAINSFDNILSDYTKKLWNAQPSNEFWEVIK